MLATGSKHIQIHFQRGEDVPCSDLNMHTPCSKTLDLKTTDNAISMSLSNHCCTYLSEMLPWFMMTLPWNWCPMWKMPLVVFISLVWVNELLCLITLKRSSTGVPLSSETPTVNPGERRLTSSSLKTEAWSPATLSNTHIWGSTWRNTKTGKHWIPCDMICLLNLFGF